MRNVAIGSVEMQSVENEDCRMSRVRKVGSVENEECRNSGV